MYSIEEGKDINGNIIYWVLRDADLVASAPAYQEAQKWINNNG